MAANHDIVRLHSRDFRLLQSLEEGRVATARQAARYVWSHPNSANRRLRELEHGGYIRRHFNVALGQTVVYPTAAGIKALIDRGIVAPSAVSWPRQLRNQPMWLAHEIDVNEIRFRLQQASGEHPGVCLIACRSGPSLYDRLVDGTPIRPDRFIVLKTRSEQQVVRAFLEVDRGSRPIRAKNGRRDVVRQLAAYDGYVDQFSEKHGMPSDAGGVPFVVLVTTPSAPRADNIIKAMGHHDKNCPTRFRASRFYASFDEFIARPFAPVWRQAGDDAGVHRISLLDIPDVLRENSHA